MQSLFSIAVAIYITFYVFEGVVRYVFHLLGNDELIFIRDAILSVPLFIIFLQQIFRKKIHPAYFIFIFVILLHGTVMMLNIGNFPAVLYGAKILITLPAGAIAAKLLFKPNRAMITFILILWSMSWVGVMLDKYFVEFPWQGITTSIDDIKVDISRDWQVSGEDKRAGGFMRSSIHVATVMPLLALLLIYNLPGLMSLAVALLTLPALFWTTQKGSLLAYLLTLAFIYMIPKRPIAPLRIGVAIMSVLAIALPTILPGYNMPQSKGGVFSITSFNLRIEEMWPKAWRWIHVHEIFPFGVGLGGISGAQRLYSLPDVNAADNVFVFSYGYFGVMSFIYLGYIIYSALRTRDDGTRSTTHALATLMFIMGYGCVVSVLEDQMASLFLGAALGWLYYIRKEEKSLPDNARRLSS